MCVLELQCGTMVSPERGWGQCSQPAYIAVFGLLVPSRVATGKLLNVFMLWPMKIAPAQLPGHRCCQKGYAYRLELHGLGWAGSWHFR